MEQVSLRAKPRDEAGTRVSRRLRAEGGIPAVLYGRGLDTTSLAVDKRDLYAALHTEAGTNALINLEVGSDKFLTVARELQRHPVRGEIVHLDFINISLDEEIDAEVGIEFIGEPEGAKEGGILQTIRASIDIAALPMNIPAHIEVDVTALEVGDTVTVGDLPQLEGVSYYDDPEEPVVTVIIPAEFEEPEIEEVLLDEEGMPILVSEDEGGEAVEGEGGEAVEGEEGAADGETEDEG